MGFFWIFYTFSRSPRVAGWTEFFFVIARPQSNQCTIKWLCLSGIFNWKICRPWNMDHFTKLNLEIQAKMRTPQFHTDPLSSTHQFHTRTTPYRHPKPLSSSHASVPHRKPLSSTHFFFVSFLGGEPEGWNWGAFGVELRGFWCGTGGLWGWKGVVLLCWTDVLNWRGVELRGPG